MIWIDEKYINEFQGLNSRLDEIQAAFLDIKLKYLDSENQKRFQIAKYYCENIQHPNINLPFLNNHHVWHLFVIRAKNRNQLQKFLADNEIETLVHYPIPPHKQLAYKKLNILSFPVTEKIHNEVLSLPISPVMTQQEVEFIVDTIKKF